MSSYFVGPFGRMLPMGNGPSSRRDEENPAKPSEPPLYQLPPPPPRPPLQFGTDPFLHQQAPEKNEPGRWRWTDTGPRTEQLPSVQQLLTPVSRSEAPSPHHAQPYATPTTSHGTQASQTLFPDSRFFFRVPTPTHEHTQQSRDLPSISHFPLEDQPDQVRSQIRAHTSLPGSPFPRDRQLHQGSRSYSREEDRGHYPSATASPAGNPTQEIPIRPHVVDERHIGDQGMCYVYSDGTNCPKFVDGTLVNANWGTTKAGKPRKRIAQACLTCREKKVKCQPNFPKCDQCQKARRHCKYFNQPRGNQAGSKSSRTASHNTRDISHGSPGPFNYLHTSARALERTDSFPGASYTPESGVPMYTPTAEQVQERLMDYEQPHGTGKRPLSRTSAGMDDPYKRARGNSVELLSNYNEILTDTEDIDRDHPLTREWEVDPYEDDPELTTHFVEVYLTHVNESIYHMLPRGRFLVWLKSCREKSLNDKMLLYCMLAMGGIFSNRTDKIATLMRYSRIARHALEQNKDTLTMQLAQGRIIMSLWYYTIGALLKSWNCIGAAVRTVCGLGYNIESGSVIVDKHYPCEYGLHPQALVECRRRTFWVAYLMDRFSSFYSPSPAFFLSHMAFLRVPCPEEDFEAQQYATAPYFQSFLDKLQPSAHDMPAVSPMSFLIEIVSLWGDLSDQVCRLSIMPIEQYGWMFQEVYSMVIGRSNDWAMKLPDNLTFTPANTERSIHSKTVNGYILSHFIYHATLLKLNRSARHQVLPAPVVDEVIRRTRGHADKILDICQDLLPYLDHQASSLRTITLNPTLGYIVLSAVDVLSAAGRMKDLTECINLVRAGLKITQLLACVWDGCVRIMSLIETRLEVMLECFHSRRVEDNHKLGFVVEGRSLDSLVRANRLAGSGSAEPDLIYGELKWKRLLFALGVGDASLSSDHVFWIREKASLPSWLAA